MKLLTATCLSLAVLFSSGFARSDLTAVHREKEALPCLGDCVKRSALIASEKRSRFRLAHWRKSARSALAWKRAASYRFGRATSGLLCIHFNPRVGHGEGPWDDSGDPYWGGLQMDRSFMSHYAPDVVRLHGLANAWPSELQIAVGVVAFYSGRGFYPWPNTARSCGLIG